MRAGCGLTEFVHLEEENRQLQTQNLPRHKPVRQCS
jgi:hypothetical protein